MVAHDPESAAALCEMANGLALDWDDLARRFAAEQPAAAAALWQVRFGLGCWGGL